MNRQQSATALKHQRKLSRTMVTVALAPAARRVRVAAIQALAEAAAHRDGKNPSAAVFICKQLLSCPAALGDALTILLETAVQVHRPAEIQEYCDRLMQSGARLPHAVSALANGLRTLNRHGDAIRVTTEAVAEYPSNLALKHLLAVLLIEVNATERATGLLRQIVKLDQSFLPAYRHLAVLDALTADEVEWLENLVTDADDGTAPGTALMALAIAFRHRKDVAREFQYLGRAHRHLAAGRTWQPADEERRTQTIKGFFDEEFFRRHANRPDNDYRPVFIVGMPRSGSTLTEQILASTAGIGDIGESKLLHWTLHDLCQRRFGSIPYLDAIKRFERSDFARLADDYASRVADIYTREPRFVDKQLDNYPFLGVLHIAFPGARFIHTLRNPLDTCLSTYQQMFSQVESGHSLGHLAVKYRNHVEVMNHWKRHLGDRVLTVWYEDLVSDPRRHAGALLEFCGIPWSDSALDFHTRDAGIKTASLLQVRRPIYASSVGKWREYAAWLEPVFRELNLAPDGSTVAPTTPGPDGQSQGK